MILTDEKALVVLICFAAAGLVFMVCGFYFMSEGFLNSLRESREDEESRRLAERQTLWSGSNRNWRSNDFLRNHD